PADPRLRARRRQHQARRRGRARRNPDLHAEGGRSMMDDLIQHAVTRMDKSVETTQHEFNSIRTGRASAALLDHVQVDYYGTPTPLNQLATINVPEPRVLTVQPLDPTSPKLIA